MYNEEVEQQQQRGNAWESAVRKTQHQLQQHQSGRRRGCLFAPMSVAPDDEAEAADAAEPSTTSEESAVKEEQEKEDDREEEDKSMEVCHAERLLSNGDLYMGQWRGGAPHGNGKYLWTDGCMYEGEWRQGRTMGQGKFSWPSGATYEGEFNSGFMHGFGTYTGSSGDTYRGLWSMNLKHGRGTKSYANGDHYDGDWHSGLQDGHGRYAWKNGNEYVGQWRAGVIHGRGSLVWSNGNRYDGSWEDGLPRGNGSFRWADGSLYIGVWTRDPPAAADVDAHQKGVYYPSPVATSPTARDPHEAFAAGIRACTICPGETVSILPSQKTLHWSSKGADPQRKLALRRPSRAPDSADAPRPRRRSSDDARFIGPPRRPNGRTNTVIGIHNNSASAGGDRSFNRICIWDSNGDITCNIVDSSAVAAGEGREGSRDATLEPQVEEAPETRMARIPPRLRWTAKVAKKQGQTISKGHKNYELMLNLQLGIRHAVGKQQNVVSTSLDLKASAFDPREKVWTKFPPEGSKHTPPHQSCDFKWKDYCPVVFRTLRRLFKVDAGEYMMSLCGNDALRELSSPGKSGSFFYLTHDDKYMIKTMKKSEVKVLLRMLPAYYNHVRAFENTLVTKFFGLHCVRLTGATQKKVRFVIIGNLFCSEYSIHRRFDLKGSSHGRTTVKPEAEIDEYTTLKDLDLNFIFRLQRSWFQEFYRQVDRDCEFLEQERIMDYSLLVGLHFRDVSLPSDIPKDNDEADSTKEATPRLSRVDMDQFLCDPTRWATIRLGVNMPARVEQTVRRSDCDSPLIGEPTGEFHEVILFFGIIDILQDYDISKKLEHAYKSIQYDPTSISAVDPKQYSKRFRDFIFRVFTEDT